MFGCQTGRHGQFTSLILLLVILLVACTSQATRVESTPTIGTEVTPTLPSTDTPEPTHTVEPSREPTIEPTAEIPTEEPTEELVQLSEKLVASLKEGETFRIVENNAIIFDRSGNLITTKDMSGNNLGNSQTPALVEGMANRGELPTSQVSENVQLAWSGEAGNSQILAMNEGQGWRSVWNLTVTLDPGYSVEIDATTNQPVFKNAKGELLYVRNNAGEYEMVPSPTQLETVNAYHEAVDFGMHPIRGDEIYKRGIDALVRGAPNYWSSLGVNPDFDSVMKYLRTVNYQVSTIAPSGNTLQLVGGDRSGSGMGVIHDMVGAGEGITIDFSDIKLMVISPGMVTGEIANASAVTEGEGFFKENLYRGERVLYFGMTFYEDSSGILHPVWVTMYQNIGTLLSYSPWDEYTMSPGNIHALKTEGISYSDIYDAKMLTAQMNGWFEYLIRHLDLEYLAVTDITAGIEGSVDIRPISVHDEEVLFQIQE